MSDPAVPSYLGYQVADGPLQVHRIKVLGGANYFSAGPVVVLRLDLGAYDEVFTSQIPGFAQRLRVAMPTLQQHHCSEGCDGGFLMRVDQGTLLGHVTEHVAIELQTLAGMDVAYGKTRSTRSAGIYNVVFRYVDDHAGVYAAKAAVNLVNALLLERPESFDLDAVVHALVQIRESRLLGPSTQAIVDVARRRGAPFIRLDDYNLLQLGSGCHRRRIRATITSETSAIAVEIAANKHFTAKVLIEAGVPVAEQLCTDDPRQVLAFAAALGGRPIVVKPCRGHKGHGTTLELTDPDEIAQAVSHALTCDTLVLAQSHVEGDYYRLLVIDSKLVATARLTPPTVVGDGQRTVAELVAALNEDPRREIGDKGRLSVVQIDQVTSRLLARRGLDPTSVLAGGETLRLKVSPSLVQGGASVDVTDLVHPDNRMLAERAARAVNLNVAGVDFIARDIGRSILEPGAGVVSAVSAAPDFRAHLLPIEGASRDVAEPLVEMLFPAGTRARIPVVAVTGTRGKTEAVRLLRHTLATAGFVVGAASSDGLFVGDEVLRHGPMTGFDHAAMVLKDPTVDCAVFEVPVETILEQGLGYDLAEVGVVLNVADEGKFYDEARLLEDVAYAKSVVVEQVQDEGASVLNADDDMVSDMVSQAYGRVVLVSAEHGNPRVRAHTDRGGRAAVIDGSYAVILDGRERIDIVHVDDLSPQMRQHPTTTLAVLAAVFALGVSPDTIRRAVRDLANRVDGPVVAAPTSS